STAEMFWWARQRVSPVRSASSRVSRAITPIISVKRPLAWRMSLSATTMPPCHRAARPRTSAPQARLAHRRDCSALDLSDDAARPGRTESGPVRPLPVADRPETQDSTAPATLATVLRGAMHLAFAVLLSLGVLRALTVDAVPPPLALAVAALVAAIYGTGTALAHRRRDPAEVSTTDLLLPSRGWVAALLGAWVVASLVSSAFVWIAFPLFFLVLFSLGRVTGPLALLLVALWAVLAPLAVGAQESLAVGEVLGPLVGAVCSLVAHTVWRRLLEESERNRRLVARLRAAQAELADSERRKGVAEERQRLAQDFHDTLAQGLNSIVLMSRAARTAH